MNIGMVIHSGYPDIRLKKEISSLIKHHNIFILTKKQKNLPDVEFSHGLMIVRVLPPKLNSLLKSVLLFRNFSYIWRWLIRRFCIQFSIDVLHVHDLLLVKTAASAIKRTSIRLVADLHENYPEMLLTQIKNYKGQPLSINKLFFTHAISYDFWKREECPALDYATSILVVSKEAKERLVKLGFSSSKVFDVCNYSSLSLVSTFPKKKTSGSYLNLIYSGGFGSTRDLSTVIKGFSLLPADIIPNIRLKLVGAKEPHESALKRLVDQYNLSTSIDIIGWVDEKLVYEFNDQATIGLVPHIKTAHTDSTMPHKIYQYLSSGLPVIVSNCTPLCRVIEDSKSGFIYQSESPTSFANVLTGVYNQSPSEYIKMSQAALSYVSTKANWNNYSEPSLLAAMSI